MTCDVARLGLCSLQVDPKAELMDILRVLFNFAQFTPFCFLAYRRRLREQQKPRSFIRASAGNHSCPSGCLDCPALLQHPASPTIPHLPFPAPPSLLRSTPPCPASLHSFSFNPPLRFSSLFGLNFPRPPQQQPSFLNAQAPGTCASAGPYRLPQLLSDLIIIPTLIVSLHPTCL